MINRTFRALTQFCFPATYTADRIASRAFKGAVVLSILVYGVCFGVAPIGTYLSFRYFGGEKPDTSVAVIAGAVLLLAIGVALSSFTLLRKKWGIVTLRFLHLCYDIPSRAALIVIKQKSFVRIMAILLLLIAASIMATAYNFTLYSRQINDRLHIASLRMERFIETRTLACRNRVVLLPILEEFETLRSLPAAGLAVNSKRCWSNFAHVLLPYYKENCPKEEDLTVLMADLDSLTCPGDPRTEAYVRAWQGKTSILLSEQGRLLYQTIDAHARFDAAKALLVVANQNSGVVSNGLGNVYANYLPQYEALIAAARWPSVDQVPQLGAPRTDPPVPVVSILNAAAAHYRRARELEEANDESFAEARYHNNMSDMMHRILLLRRRSYIDLGRRSGPLAACDPVLQEQVSEIRERPLVWLNKKREELADQLRTVQLPEVLVTIAQLGALEIEIREELGQRVTLSSLTPERYDWLTPLSAMQAALLMRFESDGFFENPEYMGMCPIVRSPVFGIEYARIIEERFPAVKVALTLERCGVGEGEKSDV